MIKLQIAALYYKKVYGHVYDKYTNQPIPGVTVNAFNNSTTTNSEGYYSIDGFSSGLASLIGFTKSGYEQKIDTIYGFDVKHDAYLTPILTTKAKITSIDAPSTFKPNKYVSIKATVKNVGKVSGKIFCRIRDTDADKIIGSAQYKTLSAGESYTFGWQIQINKTTAFHGKIEAGHEAVEL